MVCCLFLLVGKGEGSDMKAKKKSVKVLKCQACQSWGLPASRCHCKELHDLIAGELEKVKKELAQLGHSYSNIGFNCNGRRGKGNHRDAGNTRSVTPQLVTRIIHELDVTDEDDVWVRVRERGRPHRAHHGRKRLRPGQQRRLHSNQRVALGEGATLVERRAVPGRKNRYMLFLLGGCEDVI